MNPIKLKTSSIIRPQLGLVHPKRPNPIPIRPLEINRFRPPRGQKQVFLPNFVITLHCTPHRPPSTATFSVPLWFSKLDLKDYLYHAYNIQALSIRSVVLQSRVQEFPKNAFMRSQRHFNRPASQKRMVVELVTDEKIEGQGPFQWPKEPEDYSMWGKQQYDAAMKKSVRERRKGTVGGRRW